MRQPAGGEADGGGMADAGSRRSGAACRGARWKCLAWKSFRLSCSGIELHFGPGLRRRIAAEFDAVVQTERTVVPES